MTETNTTRHIFKNASVMTTLSGLGVASGLVVDALILGAFGMGYETDALFTALALPQLLTSVFSVQCPRVLIPVFAECFSHEEQEAGWGLVGSLLTTFSLLFTAVGIAGVALAGMIVPLQIPGLGPNAISLAVSLSRTLFWLVLFQGLASILQSVLYSQDRFFVGASGKLVTNTVTIVVVAFARRTLGIQAVAAGMLLGSLVQLSALATALGVRGFRLRWVFRPAEPRLVAIVKSFGYPLAGHTLGDASTIVQNFLGSFLGSGSLTVIRYAARIVQAIAGILLGSVVQVTLPMISKYAAAQDLDGQKKTFLEGIRLLSIIGVPVCVWLILAAQPMLILLFERGAFTRTDAVLTATIIGLMTPDIFLGRIASLAQSLFYANKDTKIPFISTLIYTAAHTLFASVLVRWLGVLGFPIAVSLASLSFAGYMIVKAQSRFGAIGWRELRGFGARLAAASAVAVVGFRLGGMAATLGGASDWLAKLVDFAVPTGSGACSFVIGALAFRLIDGRFFLPGGERYNLFGGRRAALEEATGVGTLVEGTE
jgi:putative peptidoglycan lipid II flippase